MHKISKSHNIYFLSLPFRTFACICFGGALGAICRYYISESVCFDYLAFEKVRLFSLQDIFEDETFPFFRFLHVLAVLFPLGILSANVIGSFLLGVFLSFSNILTEKLEQDKLEQEREKEDKKYIERSGNFLSLRKNGSISIKTIHSFFVVGFLGSLTTFSTFTLDSIKLMLPALLKTDFMQKLMLPEEFHTHFNVFDVSLSFYSSDTLAHHACALGFLNIGINIIFCLLAVWFGGKVIRFFR